MLAVVLCLSEGTAMAQGAECYDEPSLADMGQQALNICAGWRFEQVDVALNETYRAATGAVQDAGLLRDAQRAWITFRDLACAAETAGFEDGSMYPMVLNGCLERQTRRRIEDLEQFVSLR